MEGGRRIPVIIAEIVCNNRRDHKWGCHLGDEGRHRLAAALLELGDDGGVQQAVVNIRDLDAREEVLDV